VISPVDWRRTTANPLVKTLGTKGFQFRLIFCVLRISEIKLTYLDKEVTEFKGNKSRDRINRRTSQAVARSVSL